MTMDRPIMSVPSHDQRDFEFAKKYLLPIRVVIQNADHDLDAATMEQAYVVKEHGQLGPLTYPNAPARRRLRSTSSRKIRQAHGELAAP